MQIDTVSNEVFPEWRGDDVPLGVAPTPSAIGDRLKLWRRSHGATQKDFADALGVDVGTLRKYELGLNVPGGLFLARLSSHGLNINWLLLGEHVMLRQDCKRTLTHQMGGQILELADAMEVLHNSDPAKFDMLISGFLARCLEATRFANLVKQVDAQRDTLPAPLEGGPGPFDTY